MSPPLMKIILMMMTHESFFYVTNITLAKFRSILCSSAVDVYRLLIDWSLRFTNPY